ncbi:hypothetical protein ACTSEF_000579 [Escherichia albertii]
MVIRNKQNGVFVTEAPLLKYKDEDKVAREKFPFNLRNEFGTKKIKMTRIFFPGVRQED